MADLIDRDYLIEKFEDTGQPAVSEMGKGYDLGIKAALRVVKKAPAVNRWIPVEDALPENNEIVWVCLYWEKDTYVRKGYIKNEVWYTADGYRMCITPKFWMPEYIPEPPEKEWNNESF